ncbi:hypothetical protein D1007_29602 [Hordeum vulgare]|nr:hypothetical protein D1007_29602 [Hordeum vulgare]
MATRRTTGEQLQQARVSRSALWFLAVFGQVQIAAGYSAFLIGDEDRRYFTCGPWRLPLLLSMYAYMSLLMLLMSHVELFLPRVPFAVHQALLYGGLVTACAGVVNPLGSFVLGLPVGYHKVMAGWTCFVGVHIAGLLVLWVWLVSRYSGGQQPSGGTATSAAAGNSMLKARCPRRWKRYHKLVAPYYVAAATPLQ